MKKNTTQKSTMIKKYTRREMVLLGIIIVLLLFIAWCMLASPHNWWPMNKNNQQQLTSDQIKKIQQSADSNSTQSKLATDTNGSTAGTNSGGGSVNSGSTTTSTGGTTPTGGTTGTGNGDSTPPSSGDSNTAFLHLSSNIAAGQSLAQVNASANGIQQGGCTIVADTNLLGTQKVCLYQSGTKYLTVTLLNDQVISVARSGY